MLREHNNGKCPRFHPKAEPMDAIDAATLVRDMPTSCLTCGENYAKPLALLLHIQEVHREPPPQIKLGDVVAQGIPSTYRCYCGRYWDTAFETQVCAERHL